MMNNIRLCVASSWGVLIGVGLFACNVDETEKAVAPAEHVAVVAGALSDPDAASPVPPPPSLDGLPTSPISPLVPGTLDADDSEYVNVPGPDRVHRSCVHSIPPGGGFDSKSYTVFSATGAIVEREESCKYVPHAKAPHRGGTPPPQGPVTTLGAPFYEAWQGANAAGTDSSDPAVVCGTSPIGISEYCGAWYNQIYGVIWVPGQANTTDPTNSLAIWNGIIADPTTVPGPYIPIVQPVIHWGTDGNGNGGAYWSAGLWYGDSYKTFQETYIGQINPGDYVRTNVWVYDPSCSVSGPNAGNNCSWFMRAWENGSWSVTTYFPNVPGVFFQMYNLTMENYNNSVQCGIPCSMLPSNGYSYTSDVQAFQPLLSAGDFHYIAQNWQNPGYNRLFGCNYDITDYSQTEMVLGW